MVRRGKRLYIVCSKSPKHKQRQGYHTLAGNDDDDDSSSSFHSSSIPIPKDPVKQLKLSPLFGASQIYWTGISLLPTTNN